MNFDESLSRMFDLLHNGIESTLKGNKNWGRLSDMVAVIFADIASHESIFEEILSMIALE